VFGVPTLLQPAAHALLLALEDVETAASSLSAEQLWQRPGGAASAGFHRLHLAGSTDRLLTYARDQTLSEAPRAALASEKTSEASGLPADALLDAWRATVDRALQQLAATSEEHAQRHAGQLVTTAKIVRGLG
jgi:hypothetical protein